MQNNSFRRRMSESNPILFGSFKLNEMSNDEALITWKAPIHRYDLTFEKKKSCDINNCNIYKAEYCSCATKLHYKLEGEYVCLENMKPYLFVKSLKICKKCNITKP